MYQPFKGYSQSDHLQPTGELKRPLTTYSNLNLHPDKLSNQKAIRWNLEESKENVSFHKKHDLANKYAQNSTFEVSDTQTSYQTAKKGGRNERADLSKTFGTKSYKSIKFSNQLEQSYQMSKSYGNLTKDFKTSTHKATDLKELSKSLGYSSSVKDLINHLRQDSKYQAKTVQTQGKKMKSCKSQKRLYVDLDKTYDASHQVTTKTQFSGFKSYKKLAQFLSNQPVVKPKSGQEVMAGVNKNEKSMQDSSKIKNYKTWSNKEKNDIGYQFEKIKRYAPPCIQKPKDSFTTKHTLSISDFQLGSCKGQGAFGQVFPAIHKATKMLVAIKRVPKQKVKYMLDQFINEIKIQMFLDHPNIVKLYGFFDDSSYFYIIMEYMQGGSLFCYIKKQKKLTPEETATRMRQVCLGLKEMHDHSILHRDIKPQNIVITNNVCKLCDFGWSTVCKDRRTTYCGTLDYISPQIVGGKGYDDSVDIWCLGVLAYEMICGKTPFYNISRTETMKKIMNAKYEYPVELTAKARSFIDKILKKNPDDRLDIDQVLSDGFLAQ